MNKQKISDIEVGSRVFVYACGALKEYEVTSFRILDCGDELRGEVEAKVVKDKGALGGIQKFYLDTFIKGINEAQDMKISDIRRDG